MSQLPLLLRHPVTLPLCLVFTVLLDSYYCSRFPHLPSPYQSLLCFEAYSEDCQLGFSTKER